MKKIMILLASVSAIALTSFVIKNENLQARTESYAMVVHSKGPIAGFFVYYGSDQQSDVVAPKFKTNRHNVLIDAFNSLNEKGYVLVSSSMDESDQIFVFSKKL